MRIAMKGLTLPPWTSENAESHLDDVFKLRWLSGVPAALRDAAWSKSRPKALDQIRSGDMTLGKATVFVDNDTGIVTLWRIKQRLDSDLDLTGRLRDHVQRNRYFIYIASAAKFPELRNTPIEVSGNPQPIYYDRTAIPVFIDNRFFMIDSIQARVLSTLFINPIPPTKATESGFLDLCQLDYSQGK